MLPNHLLLTVYSIVLRQHNSLFNKVYLSIITKGQRETRSIDTKLSILGSLESQTTSRGENIWRGTKQTNKVFTMYYNIIFKDLKIKKCICHLLCIYNTYMKIITLNIYVNIYIKMLSQANNGVANSVKDMFKNCTTCVKISVI